MTTIAIKVAKSGPVLGPEVQVRRPVGPRVYIEWTARYPVILSTSWQDPEEEAGRSWAVGV